MPKIPTGYEIFMKTGSKKEVHKIKEALKKENSRKTYKIKKLGYRNDAVLRYKY